MADWKIGNMLWRIGDMLPVREQIEWSCEAGFDGVGLHASPGVAGVWEGVDPAQCDVDGRRELRSLLAGFALREVHAPFAISLTGESLAEGVAQLDPVLAFAGDIGAQVVTVHAESPDGGWKGGMTELDARAGEREVEIGLEITAGFAAAEEWDLAHIGITLDVGHIYAEEGGARLEPFGSIGNVVRGIGGCLKHLHVHDVAELDHVEIGGGRVDFEDLLSGLDEIGYARGMCLEMNPDRVSPEGIRRSLARLRSWKG